MNNRLKSFRKFSVAPVQILILPYYIPISFSSLEIDKSATRETRRSRFIERPRPQKSKKEQKVPPLRNDG